MSRLRATGTLDETNNTRNTRSLARSRERGHTHIHTTLLASNSPTGNKSAALPPRPRPNLCPLLLPLRRHRSPALVAAAPLPSTKAPRRAKDSPRYRAAWPSPRKGSDSRLPPRRASAHQPRTSLSPTVSTPALGGPPPPRTSGFCRYREVRNHASEKGTGVRIGVRTQRAKKGREGGRAAEGGVNMCFLPGLYSTTAR